MKKKETKKGMRMVAKRIIACLMALCMILIDMPWSGVMQAKAADGSCVVAVYKGADNSGSSVTQISSTDAITISVSGENVSGKTVDSLALVKTSWTGDEEHEYVIWYSESNNGSATQTPFLLRGCKTQYYNGAVPNGSYNFMVYTSDEKEFFSDTVLTIEGSSNTNPTYNVTYNLDGGTGNISNGSYQSPITLPQAPEKQGFTFTGWKEDNGGEIYSAGTSLPITGAMSFTAQWEKAQYTVSYNLNGAAGTTPESATVDYNTSITLPDASERDGYIFSGWSDGNVSYPAGSTYVVTDNIQFQAVWQEIERGDLVIHIPQDVFGSVQLKATLEDDSQKTIYSYYFGYQQEPQSIRIPKEQRRATEIYKKLELYGYVGYEYVVIAEYSGTINSSSVDVTLEKKGNWTYVESAEATNLDASRYNFVSIKDDTAGANQYLPGLLDTTHSYTLKFEYSYLAEDYYEYDWRGYNGDTGTITGNKLTAAFTAARIPQNYTVSGVVKSKDDKPVSGAIVSIEQYVGGRTVVRTAMTNVEGAYEVKDLYKTDSASIKVSYNGIRLSLWDTSDSINLTADNVTCNIKVDSNKLIVTQTIQGNVSLDSAHQSLRREYIWYLNPEVMYYVKKNDSILMSRCHSVISDESEPLTFGLGEKYEGQTLTVEVKNRSGFYDASSVTSSVQESGIRTANVALHLRGGILANIKSDSGNGNPTWRLMWYDSNNKYVGVSQELAVSQERIAAACPGPAGSYTVVLVPTQNYEIVRAGTYAEAVAKYQSKSVEIKDNAAEDIGTFTVSSVERLQAAYVTQPNSVMQADRDGFSSTSELVRFIGHIGLDDGMTGKLTGDITIDPNEGMDGRYESSIVLRDCYINGKRYTAQTSAFGKYVIDARNVELPCDFMIYASARDVNHNMEITVFADAAGYHNQYIGNCQVLMPGASIETLSTYVNSPKVSLSGAVQGNETVTIYDNEVEIGSATADINGHWTAQVDLYKADSVYTSGHTIYAVSESGTRSQEKTIWHIPGGAELKEMTMGWIDHCGASFKIPINGKYIFTGAMNDVKIAARFDNPGKLEQMEMFECKVAFIIYLSNGSIMTVNAVDKGEGWFEAAVDERLGCSIARVEIMYQPDKGEERISTRHDSELGRDIEVIGLTDQQKQEIGAEFENLPNKSSLDDEIEMMVECEGVEAYKKLVGEAAIQKAIEEEWQGLENAELTDIYLKKNGKVDTAFSYAKNLKAPTDKKYAIYTRANIYNTRESFMGSLKSLPDAIHMIKFTYSEGQNYYIANISDPMYDENGELLTDPTYNLMYIFMEDKEKEIFVEQDFATVSKDFNPASVETLQPKMKALSVSRAVDTEQIESNTSQGTSFGADTMSIWGMLLEGTSSTLASGGGAVLSFMSMITGASAFDQNMKRMQKEHDAVSRVWGSRCVQLIWMNDWRIANNSIDIDYWFKEYDKEWRKKRNAAASSFAWTSALGVAGIIAFLPIAAAEAGASVSATTLASAEMINNTAGVFSTATDVLSFAGGLFSQEQFNYGYQYRLKDRIWDFKAETFFEFISKVIQKHGAKYPECKEWTDQKIRDGMTPMVSNDPAGIVYEAVIENPVKNATVSLYYGADSSGKKIVGAENVGNVKQLKAAEDIAGELIPECSTQSTNADGYYQWGVPEGLWKVTAAAPGYNLGDSLGDIAATVSSTEGKLLPVLPVQLDVNIPLVDNTAPYVMAVKPTTDGIYVTYSKYMVDSALDDSSVLDKTNYTVTVNSNAVDVSEVIAEEQGHTPANRGAIVTYTKTVLIKLSVPLALTDRVGLSIKDSIQSYAGTKMDQLFEMTPQQVKAKEQVNQPVFSPNGGVVTKSTAIELTCATADAKIYYTTDGTTPTVASKLYNKPISITAQTTIKAIATKSGCMDSNIAIAEFYLTLPPSGNGSGGNGTGNGHIHGDTAGDTTGSNAGGQTTPSNEKEQGSTTVTTTVTKEVNSAGNEVEVTKTVVKDADGNIVETIIRSKINVSAKTTAIITVVENASGKSTATAEIDRTISTKAKSTTINATLWKQIIEAAGGSKNIATDIVVSDSNGTRYIAKVSVNDIVPNTSLTVYKISKVGEYIIISANKQKIDKNAKLILKLPDSKKYDYALMNSKDAAKIEKAILKTITLQESSKSIKVGKKYTIKLNDKFNTESIKSIKYSTSKKSIAMVSSKGVVKGIKKGSATIKVVVTLKNGTRKTLKLKVKIK